MNKFFSNISYATLCSSLCIATALISASHASAETINIPVGRSQLISVSSDMTEVVVANPDTADAYVHGKRKVSVMGKEIGVTSVRILGKKGQLRNLDVNVTYDLPAMRKALKELLPNETIGVEMVNTNIAITGQVTSALAAERAARIVKEFIMPSFSQDQQAAAAPAGEDGGGGPQILNLLEVTSGQQVMLRVRVGEIRRSALKNLGLELQALKSGTDSAIGIATGTGLDLFDTAGAQTLGQYGAGLINNDVRGIIGGTFQSGSGSGISAALQALERDNLFKVLAEPNLVAVSGEEAQFLAGGEFPVPVPQQLDNITIQFKPFGVSVKFTPFVLSENRIRIAVEPEVSEINNDAALTIQGFNVPGLTTRRAQTVVELSPGESFMIAGLISDSIGSRIESLPGIKEIPILGALFSSVSFQREETELVLAVTPYIVDPIVSADVKLPSDNFRPASLMEMFFYGAMGSLHGDIDRISQTPTIEGPIGFMVD